MTDAPPALAKLVSACDVCRTADVAHSWSVSNPGPDTLLLWLEPWAEEFEIPARSTVALTSSEETVSCLASRVEWTVDHLVVWAGAGRVAVSVDGVLQRTSSAAIPVPNGLTKEMLSTLFADHPFARLGGSEVGVVPPCSGDPDQHL